MEIEQRFKRRPFADLEYGALFAAVIGRRYGIRAIKAYAEINDKNRVDFFVTVGPFNNETGQFPTLHRHSALYDEHVLELIGGYQISPSLSPDDFMPELPLAGSAIGVLLILQNNQILMSVADIENVAPRILRRWFDVKTGELLLRLGDEDCIVTRRWRITAPVENAAPEMICDFKAETEGP